MNSILTNSTTQDRSSGNINGTDHFGVVTHQQISQPNSRNIFRDLIQQSNQSHINQKYSGIQPLQHSHNSSNPSSLQSDNSPYLNTEINTSTETTCMINNSFDQGVYQNLSSSINFGKNSVEGSIQTNHTLPEILNPTAPPPAGAPPPLPYQSDEPFDSPNPISESVIDARSPIDQSIQAENNIRFTSGGAGCAKGRSAFLNAAIKLELAKFLVEQVLENPTLINVKDPASVKVHSIELLKLLTLDPAYGLQFNIILDSISLWKKYKNQDHSLFITGVEQKIDYFLLDGVEGNKKLLTAGNGEDIKANS